MIVLNSISSFYFTKQVLKINGKRHGLELTPSYLKIIALCIFFFSDTEVISIKRLIKRAASDGNGELTARTTSKQLKQLEQMGYLTSKRVPVRGVYAIEYTIQPSLFALAHKIDKSIAKSAKTWLKY